jgi:hypothetical protein
VPRRSLAVCHATVDQSFSMKSQRRLMPGGLGVRAVFSTVGITQASDLQSESEV